MIYNIYITYYIIEMIYNIYIIFYIVETMVDIINNKETRPVSNLLEAV